MVTEAKKAANKKWDKENMTTLGCRVRRDLAEQFKEVCAANGTTPSTVFRVALEEYMAAHTTDKE